MALFRIHSDVGFGPYYLSRLGFENDDPYNSFNYDDDDDDQQSMLHAHIDTVSKDIARSLCNYDICQNWTEELLLQQRTKLSWIINKIMSKHAGFLHYIQGYHDLCSVFLIVCDYNRDVAFALCERVSLFHLREILRPDLSVIIEVLDMLFPLLYQVDAPVAAFLIRSNAKSFFALSWVLTWFSHTFYRFQDVARVFDFLLASHPCMPLYIAAAFVIMHRDGLFRVECEMSMIHQYFQGQTSTDLSILLPLAAELFDKYPPYSLFRLCRPRFPTDCVLPVQDIFKLYKQKQPLAVSTLHELYEFPSQIRVNIIQVIGIVIIGVILWRISLYLAQL